MDDDVDLAQPVECLFGLDLGAGCEGEADEVAEGVVGGFAVHGGHAGVAGGEGPEHRHRLWAAALADQDAVGVHPQRVGDERLRVYLYHIPPVSAVPITHKLVERLLKAYPGQIAGMKDSSDDWAHTKSMIDAFAKDGFDVF